MSYILDALRKADAQRERDPATRGIHAQPVSAAMTTRSDRPAAARWRWGLAGVAGAALVAVAVWQLISPSGPKVADDAETHRKALPGIAATPAVSPAPAAALQASAALPATAAAPAPAVLPTAPPPARPPVARAIPLPPAMAPVVPSRAAGKPSGTASGMASAPAPPALVPLGPAPLGSAPPVTVPAVAAAPPARVWAVNELPADLQRELPKLTISGGVYSDNPAQRMLIVNGQVVGEGAEPAPGVLLEQIRAKTAVLRFRSYRYAISY